MPLRDVEILLVEDNALIAMDIVAVLEEAGATVKGPIRSVRAASEYLQMEGDDPHLDGVILDYNLTDGTSDGLAMELDHAGIPFVFHSANADTVPALAESLGVQVVPKPVPEYVLIDAIQEMVRRDCPEQS